MLVAEAGLSGFAEQKPDPVVEAFGAFGALAKSSLVNVRLCSFLYMF